MIRISQLKLSLGHSKEEMLSKIGKELRIPVNAIEGYTIKKKSIDARKKPDIKLIYTVDVQVKNEIEVIKRSKSPSVTVAKKEFYQFPKHGDKVLKNRPVIVGFGPAGLFCGLMLAREGYRPLILERGKDVDSRKKDVDQFWKTGTLNEQSNVQYGEGGAGTFSDGKLNTLVKDPAYRNRKVLEEFVAAGAPEEILYLNKPHIGTDILCDVVKNIREEIISLGGEVRFESQVTDFITEENKLVGVEVNKKEKLPCQVLVLAIGHSARDTFEAVLQTGASMKSKAFAVGLRIEHPQSLINLSQYGKEQVEQLSAADYKVTKQTSNGRGVYSFCMCPGGYVVNASSELGRLAVNGMSNHARDTRNANSALIVTVTPDDFSETGPLAGVAFQRKLEEAAFGLCNGKIPVQLLGDFRSNRMSTTFGEVLPSMKGDFAFGNLRSILPEYLTQSLLEGIDAFDHMIKGFGRPDAIFSGVESRTSSPVRIERDECYESNIRGIYPCGEGAGYAGGITSAAMDGIRVAERIAQKFKNIQ